MAARGDSLSGGAGNDLFMVDQLGDLLADRSGADSVIAAVDFSLGAGFEFLKLEHTAVRGTGNGSANLLIGNAAANLLAGGGGERSLRGENGNDTLTAASAPIPWPAASAAIATSWTACST